MLIIHRDADGDIHISVASNIEEYFDGFEESPSEILSSMIETESSYPFLDGPVYTRGEDDYQFIINDEARHIVCKTIKEKWTVV